jgi:predicted ATP-grasp superfamily ATP-dependent carboligase
LLAPPVLLARPGYAGTVAAVRDLGRDHIAVYTLASGVLDSARWSKYVCGSVPVSRRFDPDSLLLAIQRAAPTHGGHVLLPTCDVSAWTYAAHAAQLSQHYVMYAPPLETINRLLDKTSVEEAFAHAGIGLLKSWVVRNKAELEALRDELLFPLIAKPRAHVSRSRNDKGAVVYDYAQLLASISDIEGREDVFCDDVDTTRITGYFFQQFVDKADKGVLSVSGFIDRSGTRLVARAARKVMQRTEPAGVGVCFESAPMEPALADAVARLCRNLGYFGVFEVEFLWAGSGAGGGWAAIDFNPRFYNQMRLDTARGMPLARLCYYDAIGDTERLAALVAQAQAAPADTWLCLRDGFTMNLLLLVRSLGGQVSRADRRRWRQWNRNPMIDLIRTPDDPWVWPVHMVSEVALGLRKLAQKAADRLRRHHHV